MMSKHKFTYFGIKGIVEAQIQRNGKAGVIFGVETPFTDAKGTVYLPTPPLEPSYEEAMKYFYMVFHEINHHDKRKDDWVAWLQDNKINATGFVGKLGNISGDINNDYHYTDEYAGMREAINIGRYAFFRDMILPQYIELKGKKTEDEKQHIFKVLMAWMNAAMGCYLPAMTAAREQLEKYLEGKELSQFTALMESDYYNRFMVDDNSVSRHETMKELLKEIFDFEIPPEEEQEEKGDGSSGKGKGEKEEGDGEEGEEEGEGEEQCDAHVKWEDLNFDDHNEAAKLSHKSLTIDYTGYSDTGTSGYKPQDQREVKTFTSDTSYYRKSITESFNSVSKISSKKMRKLLKIKSEESWDIDQKKGSLDTPRLHRAITGHTRDQKNTIWKQPRKEDILDTVVTVLVDCSGSMGGAKYKFACVGMALLNSCITPLRIPIRLCGFSQGHHEYQDIFVWKDFGDNKISNDKLIEKCSSIPHMGNNIDGDAIFYEYHLLMKRKEKKKVLIVLSDGQPAGHHAHNFVGFTREVIKRIEKGKRCDIYGIGILTDHVKKMYSASKVIQRAEELPNAIIDTIRQKVL